MVLFIAIDIVQPPQFLAGLHDLYVAAGDPPTIKPGPVTPSKKDEKEEGTGHGGGHTKDNVVPPDE